MEKKLALSTLGRFGMCVCVAARRRVEINYAWPLMYGACVFFFMYDDMVIVLMYWCLLVVFYV